MPFCLSFTKRVLGAYTNHVDRPGGQVNVREYNLTDPCNTITSENDNFESVCVSGKWPEPDTPMI